MLRDHKHEHTDFPSNPCLAYRVALEAEEEIAALIVQRDEARAQLGAVLKLWDDNNAWIPGAAFEEFANALGIDPMRTLPVRHGGQSQPT